MVHVSRQQPTIADSGRTVADGCDDTTMPARRALKKPAVLLYTVVTAWRAWLTALLLCLALVFLVRPTVRFALEQVFPPKVNSKMLGIVKTQKPHPAARVGFGLIMITAWIAVGGIVYIRFKRHIPVGIAAAGDLSEKWAAEADELSATERTRSRRLYTAARWLAVDTRQERILTKVLANGVGTQPPPNATAARTITPKPQDGSNDRYRIEAELGRGAMGVVYRATDIMLDRTVALKELPARLAADIEYVERFRREARALAKLTHPNIVQVYDLSEQDGHIWMALEFVDGGTLEDLLEREGTLAPEQAASIISQAAAGLELAHSRGIYHRDIKPSNILITSDRTAKISDFGIAKLARSTALTQDGATLGSPAYMSPEQCSGETIDHRTDIYALGVTFYQLLAGKPPFEGDTASVLAQHLVSTPRSLAERIENIPEQLERVVMKMLAKDPDKRQQCMNEVIADIVEFVGGGKTLASREKKQTEESSAEGG
jgi:hypothetical protein